MIKVSLPVSEYQNYCFITKRSEWDFLLAASANTAATLWIMGIPVDYPIKSFKVPLLWLAAQHDVREVFKRVRKEEEEDYGQGWAFVSTTSILPREASFCLSLLLEINNCGPVRSQTAMWENSGRNWWPPRISSAYCSLEVTSRLFTWVWVQWGGGQHWQTHCRFSPICSRAYLSHCRSSDDLKVIKGWRQSLWRRRVFPSL